MAKSKKRNPVFRILLIVGVLMIVMVFILLNAGRDRREDVMVEMVQQKTILASVTESGVVEPVLQVNVTADVPGEIVELMVKEGEAVKKGKHIVTIRPDNFRSQLDQARASLNSVSANKLQAEAAREQAKANYLQDSANLKRSEQLFRDKVISQMEIDNTKLKFNISLSQWKGAIASAKASAYQVESSRASLSQARQNLDRTEVNSPMDGIITRLNRKLGESVVGTGTMAGTDIFTVADLSLMQVSVEINENDIVDLRIGDSALVEIDAFENRKFRGKVTEIAYSATLNNFATTDQITNFKVKVQIDPGSYQGEGTLMRGIVSGQSPFRPGMSAMVEIFTERAENVVAVPIQAVTYRKAEGDEEGSEIVFVEYDEGKVKAVKVTTGISDDKFIVVLSGLNGGESIVTGPYATLSKKLKDGDEVKRMKEKKKRK